MKSIGQLSILLFLLALKAFLLVFIILNAGIGLGPDEAQYWTWSQALDWGYYSKPPGIAWEIAFGTWLLGDTELGVRSMPLVIGSLLTLAVYFLSQRCKSSPRVCFWGAVCFAFSPLGILASFLAITDGGMVLFWTVACGYIAGKIQEEKTPSYLLIGLFIFFGALFKWPIYNFWLIVLASWLFFPYLRSKRILWGMILSLAALLPSVYWNAAHEWATFRHVFATLAGGHGAPNTGAPIQGNPLEFLGSQAVLVSPILFILLCLAWVDLIRRKKQLPDSIRFCGWTSLIIIAAAFFLSFFMKLQGNWAIFAYPSAFALLGWYAINGIAWKKNWLISGAVFSFALSMAVFSIPYLQSHALMNRLPIPYKISPFRHNVGWNELKAALAKAGYNPERDFLFGDKYQTASILSFYGPEQKRAYFLNLQGSRKNQFSFWPGIDQEEKGNKGFFAVIENSSHLEKQDLSIHYEKALAPYFQKVRYLGTESLFKAYGKTVKGVLIFECEGFHGFLPQETNLY